jgi:hypothetical protein
LAASFVSHLMRCPLLDPSRRFQRLTISVAIGEQRTWLDLLMVRPGRE